MSRIYLSKILFFFAFSLICQLDALTLMVTVSPNIVGATNTTLQITLSSSNYSIPESGYFFLNFGNGTSLNGQDFELLFFNQAPAQIEEISMHQMIISNFGPLNSSHIYFQIQGQNGSDIIFSQNDTEISLDIFDSDGNQLDFGTCKPLILPASLTLNISTVTESSRPQPDLALCIISPVNLPTSFILLLTLPYLDDQNTLSLINAVTSCELMNISIAEPQSIICSQLSPTQILINQTLTKTINPGRNLVYQIGPITPPYKVGALYNVQICLQTFDGATIAQGNTSLITSNPLEIESVGVTSTSTQVGTSTNLTLTFLLSWILPGNSTLVLSFESIGEPNWINLFGIITITSSYQIITSLTFQIYNSEVNVYSLSTETVNISAFSLEMIQFQNPPSIGSLNSFNASILSPDGYIIYEYPETIALPLTAGKIISFSYNSVTFEPEESTNLTLKYQYATSVLLGTAKIFLPLGMKCTPFTACQTIPASNVSCKVNCSANEVDFSVFPIISASTQSIFINDLVNPNITPSQISFGLSTYYRINQDLYLVDILDPPIIYSKNNGDLQLISSIPSGYTAGENCIVDLYLICNFPLDSNATLVLEFSNTLSFSPSNFDVNITLAETDYTTALLITKITNNNNSSSLYSTNNTTTIELIGLPLISNNKIFCLHLSNVTLPRSVGSIGLINISTFNTNTTTTNNYYSLMSVVTADIEAKYPGQIGIITDSVGSQRPDSTLPISFNIALSSSFIPFSDYLEFTYPPEVEWEPSRSYFTSATSNLLPNFTGNFPQNRTVRATLNASVQKDTPFEIALFIVSNNSYKQVGAFEISFYDQFNYLIGQSAAVYPIDWNNSPISSFQNVIISFSNLIISNLTNCTLSMSLSLQIPVGGCLTVNFPPLLVATPNNTTCEATTLMNDYNNNASLLLLTCLILENGTIIVSSKNDLSPILASIQIEILIINAATPSKAGSITLEFSFETWGAGRMYVLQKGQQTYDVTFVSDPYYDPDDGGLNISTSNSGSSHWFPVLTIYCLGIVCVAILQRLILKKYYITIVIISLWSTAEFPCLGYSIYYFAELELPSSLSIEYDFPTTVITVVVIILMAGIIVHAREIFEFKKRLNASFSNNDNKKIIKFLWVCAIFTNFKILWILFYESHLKNRRTKIDSKKYSLFLPRALNNCGIQMNFLWLLICSIFNLSKAIIDSVSRRNGYYFLFEIAGYYILSAILIIFFNYCKSDQRQATPPPNSSIKGELVFDVEPSQQQGTKSEIQTKKNKEIVEQEANQNVSIPSSSLSGGSSLSIILEASSSAEDKSPIKKNEVINLRVKSGNIFKECDQSKTKAPIVDELEGSQEENNSSKQTKLGMSPQPRNQKDEDSPFHTLMKKLNLIHTYYSNRS